MKLKAPKWTHGYTDRHGKSRFYLRRPGHKQIPLPGLPWSPQFMAAREAALKGERAKVEVGARRTVEGTVSAALVSYYKARAFNKELAPQTQQGRRSVLESFRAEHGDKRIALMGPDHLQAIITDVIRMGRQHVKERQTLDAAAEDRRSVRHSDAARATCRNRIAADARSTRLPGHRLRQAVHCTGFRPQVPHLVRRCRAETLHLARFAQGRCRSPRNERCNGTRTDGVVRLENDWRGAAVHRGSEPHQAGRECRRSAHIGNTRWLTVNPGEPKRAATHCKYGQRKMTGDPNRIKPGHA
jgi:hypothetical protein